MLAADALCLGKEARLAVDAGCDYLHMDIMDGVFVPNLSFGPHILAGLSREVDAVYDAHLMLMDPLPYIDVFAGSGADLITVHVEAEHFEQSIARIRHAGLRAGAALKPKTLPTDLRRFLTSLDMILVMTVEPGFGGQTLMEDQIHKIRELRNLGFQGEIEVDGGISMENAERLVAAGANTLVMGTSFFTAEDPRCVANRIRRLDSGSVFAPSQP